jgi:tRNA threonylcarbamoyladenosine biosynthesis protein TsaE
MSRSQAFKELKTKSARGTQNLGKKLAQNFLVSARPSKGALVIGLEGDLGGGKTTFVQGFAKGLGIKEKILSPTFVILKKFKIPNRKFKTFYHIDCYRIQGPKDILDLGFNETISNPENIIIIEWADKIKKILPKKATILEFEFVNEKTRKIMLK